MSRGRKRVRRDGESDPRGGGGRWDIGMLGGLKAMRWWMLEVALQGLPCPLCCEPRLLELLLELRGEQRVCGKLGRRVVMPRGMGMEYYV